MFFVSKGNLLEFYFTAAGVKYRVATVKIFPVLDHNADYIFISFGIIEPIQVTLKIEYRFRQWEGEGRGRGGGVEWGVRSLENYIVAYEGT